MSDFFDSVPPAAIGVIFAATLIAQALRKRAARGRAASMQAPLAKVAAGESAAKRPRRASAGGAVASPASKSPFIAAAAAPPVLPKPTAAPLRPVHVGDAMRAPRVPLRFAGPGWAVNAVVAAEIFGRPIALRTPGDGTVLPPRAL